MSDVNPAAETGGAIDLSQGLDLLRSKRPTDTAPANDNPGQTEAEAPDSGDTLENEIQPEDGQDGGPAKVTAEDKPADADSPPIDAPKSWSDEEKEAFKALPRAVQEKLAQRESKRDAEINRRLNEAADQRKAIEAERAAFETERQKHAAAPQHGLEKLAHDLQTKWKDTDWKALARENPVEYVAQKAEYDADVAQIQTAHHEAQKAAYEEQTKAKATYDKFVADEQVKLAELIPEMADPDKGPKLQETLRTFATELGYTPQDMKYARARDIALMHDALRWREAQKLRAAARPAPQPAQAVQRPGTSQTQSKAERAAAEADGLTRKLERSGKVEDALALLQAKRRA